MDPEDWRIERETQTVCYEGIVIQILEDFICTSCCWSVAKNLPMDLAVLRDMEVDEVDGKVETD